MTGVSTPCQTALPLSDSSYLSKFFIRSNKRIKPFVSYMSCGAKYAPYYIYTVDSLGVSVGSSICSISPNLPELILHVICIFNNRTSMRSCLIGTQAVWLQILRKLCIYLNYPGIPLIIEEPHGTQALGVSSSVQSCPCLFSVHLLHCLHLAIHVASWGGVCRGPSLPAA